MATPDLDISRLNDYLAATIPGFSGDLSAEKFPGGQSNPTYKLTAGKQHYVLRRKTHGRHSREFRSTLLGSE